VREGRLKFRLLRNDDEKELHREFLSEGAFHFVKKPLPACETGEKKKKLCFFRWRRSRK
jgi:hypothetical protein